MSFYNLPLTVANGGPSPALNNQTVTFIAGGTIVLGDVVAFDTSLTGADAVATVVQAGTTATVGNARAFGFAAAAAVSGETVPVVVAGYFKSANVDAATVAGSPLCGPVTAAGRAEICSAAMTAPVFAVALAADASNVAPVFVFRRI
jgi:hypothetical protein